MPTPADASGLCLKTLYDLGSPFGASPASLMADGVYVWAIRNTDVVKINLSTGAVTTAHSFAFGLGQGITRDAAGNVYVFHTGTGGVQIAQFDVFGGLTDPWVTIPNSNGTVCLSGDFSHTLIVTVYHSGGQRTYLVDTLAATFSEVTAVRSDLGADHGEYDYNAIASDGTVWLSLDPPPVGANFNVNTTLRRWRSTTPPVRAHRGNGGLTGNAFGSSNPVVLPVTAPGGASQAAGAGEEMFTLVIGTADVLTAPTGWTRLIGGSQGSSWWSFWHKTAGGAEPTSYTWLLNATTGLNGPSSFLGFESWSGVTDFSLLAASAATGAPATAPSLTIPAATGQLSAWFAGALTAGNSWPTPDGWVDLDSPSTTDPYTFAVGSIESPLPGASGNQISTPSGGAVGDNVGIQIYLRGGAAPVTDFGIQTLVNLSDDGSTEAYGGIFTDENDNVLVPMITYQSNGVSTNNLSWILRVDANTGIASRVAGTWDYGGSPAPPSNGINIADGKLSQDLASEIDQGAGMSFDRKTLYLLDSGDNVHGVTGNLLRSLTICKAVAGWVVGSITIA